MKKYLLIFGIFFFLLMSSAAAKTDWSTGTLTCNYKNGNDSIVITYYNVGAALGDAEVYYRIEYKKNNTNYCYTDSMADKCPNTSTPWATLGIYNYNSSFNYGSKTFYSIRNRLTRYTYNEKTNFNEDTLCSLGAFVITVENMEYVALCETSKDTLACNYSSDDLFTLNGKAIGISSSAGSTDIDYTDDYNEARAEQDKYCDEDSSDYNADLCEQATNDVNTIGTAAEENGGSIANLEMKYLTLKNTNYNQDWDTSRGCTSYLGDPNDVITKPPAYYLQFVFNLMKYIAIIILFVMTLVDFFKAITQKDDALKKVLQTAIKRLIICVIIFFLPMLVEFLLKIFGIYSNCGIS